MRSATVPSRTILLLLTLFAALGLVLSLPDAARGPGNAVGHLFPPETIGIVALLAMVGRVRSPRVRRVGMILLAAATGYLIGFAVVEAAIHYIYARPFVPASDIPMVRSLIQLTLGPTGVANALTPIIIVLLFMMFFAVGALWTGGALFLLRRVPRPERALMTVIVVLVAGWIGTGPALAGSRGTADSPSRPLAVEAVAAWFRDGSLHLREIPYVDDVEPAGAIAAGDEGGPATGTPVAAADPGTPDPASTFPGIRDRDLYIFAVEAYGYATVTQDEIARRLAPDLAELSAVLDRHGYTVAGSYLRSPVAGGFSWLAEATFLTGQWINAQPAFEELYGAGAPTLTGVLQKGGYHTFTVRPGTVHGSWPEGWDLYRFEHALVAHDGDFGYRGPVFSYVAITDQYAIWSAHAYIAGALSPEGIAADRPLLAYYQLVSSHTPFNRIPPVIESWDALGDGTVYRERSAETLLFDNTWSGGTEMIEGYSAAISYVLRSITKYIDELMIHERDPIIVIFGDHQAQRPIRENDAHLSVPIHIAARDREVIESFLERGFEEGLISSEAPPHRDMSDFFPLFVEIARERHP
jgi:hypothetical protein